MDLVEIEAEAEALVEDTPQEKLFDFLYKVGQHYHHPEVLPMF